MLKTIKQKLVVLGLVLLMIAIAESIMSIRHVSAVKENADIFRNQLLPSVATLRSLEMNVIQVQQWLTDISATRGLDGLNDGFDMAAEHASEFEKNISFLAELNPDLADTILTLRVSFKKYYRVGKNMARAYIDGGPKEGNKTMASFDQAAESLHEKIDRMSNEIEDMQRRSLITSKDDIDGTVTQSIAAIALLLGFLLITAVSIQLLLISPLLRFEHAIHRFNEGTASLCYRFNHPGNDEISSIANELDTFFESLQEMSVALDDQANKLANEVESTVSVAHQSHQGIITQQDEIQMVTAAIEEMSATSTEVAQKTEMTATKTNNAKELAIEGAKVVMTTIGSINSVAANINETSKIMTQLALDTEKIEAMLDVIKSIAEQTNLLALNAAIEAARAGEQGRGFAVVADEVRTLAGKTQDSTNEITQIVTSLQQVSGNAVRQMNENCSEVESCVSNAAQSGELMSNISGTAEEISDMATQISAAMEQQTAVSAEIARSISKVYDVSVENASGSKLTISSMENLDINSKNLQEMANRFSQHSQT